MSKGFRGNKKSSSELFRHAIAATFVVAGASAWATSARAQDLDSAESPAPTTADTATLAQAEGAVETTVESVRSGALQGRVANKQTGGGLGGAIVEIVELGRTETTRADGSFRMLGVAPGDYTIKVTYYGFEAQESSIRVGSGQTATQSFELSSAAPADADEIVVTARRREEGQAKAINQQRTAKAVETVISEELFGQVNDGNVANALQRLPGLSVDTDGSSEIPRYVNVRGISTAFNNVQLDGVRLPTIGTGRGDAYGDTGRGFALDDLPADAIASVRIIKAPTPDMDGDGLGGTINLVTRSAFEQPERKTTFKIGGNYNALREQTDPEAALTFSDVFEVQDGRRLGVSVTGSFYQTNEGFDNRDLDYNPLRPGALINQGLATQSIAGGGLDPRPVSPGSVQATEGPGLAQIAANTLGERPFVSGGTAPKEIVSYHEDTEYNTFIIERDRIGLAAAFDYELDDRTRVYARPLYNNEQRDNDDRRYHKIMDNDHGDGSGSVGAFDPANPQSFFLSRRIIDGPTAGPLVRLGADPVRRSTVDFVNENFGRATLDANGNPRGMVRYNQTYEQEDISLASLSFGGERNYERSVLDVSANISRADKTVDGSTAIFTRNGFAFEYDRSDRFAARDEQFRVINNEYSYLPQVDVNELVVDASRIDTIRPSTLRSQTEDVTEDRFSLGVDFEREIDFGSETALNGTWKTGAKLGRSDRDYDLQRVNYAMAGPSSALYEQIPFASFIRDNEFSVDGQEMPFYFDPRAVLAYAADAASQAGGAVSINQTSSDRDSVLTDYTATEDTFATYVMGTIEAGPLEVIGGVRWEHTRFEATRVAVDGDDDSLSDATDKSDYDNILPGLLANYEITDNLLLRGALTNTFSRPQLVDLINVLNVNELDDPVEIEGGNPNLPPIESRNTDISMEWYLKDGFYSAGVFRKEITGFSFEAISIQQNVAEFGGRDVQTSTPLATGNATNQGVELAAYQKLAFLPFPFSGFYANLSYTWTDSSADYPGRRETELPTRGASEHLFATSVGYEWRRLAAALSYRYRSPYIEGLALEDLQGENSFIEDDNFGASQVWDATFSYRVLGDVTFYANVTNLFEETVASRQGYLDTPEDIYFNQRRIAMGLRGSF
ncbi:MAG: TonB-dependent receptor [Panacagrimonas sp.]